MLRLLACRPAWRGAAVHAALAAALLLAAEGAVAQSDPSIAAQGARRSAPESPNASSNAANQNSKDTHKLEDKSKETVIVEATRVRQFNRATRFDHSLPEVDGPAITVTKKTSVVKLDEQPAIIDNNQREVFDHLPGVVLAEQQNPTELNLSYRGLGNPQESEYVLVLQDGLPLELDFIGYPTLYNLPVPQTISSVQMIRGGSGLLYGPEPQPVIDFVSRAPEAAPVAGTFEQVGGGDGLFSSFNRVSGTNGSWDYLADFARRQSDGQRANGDYALNSVDAEAGYRIDDHQRISVALHTYELESGLAGLMLASQFRSNPQQTTTPDDRLWTDRYTGVLTYDNKFSDRDELVQKLWTGYTDLITRSDTYSSDFASSTCSATTACDTLAGQRFHYTGLDGRFLHRWARGNALTLGYTVYSSDSPYTQLASTNPLAPRDLTTGRLAYLDERSTRYGALFAENVFRLPGLHVVTSARVEHERLSTDEIVASRAIPAGLSGVPLTDRTYNKSVPLFGIGIGNDFGRGNETYLNVSQGFRPLRYLDIASPFSNFGAQNNPNPTRYLSYEAGVHGWPLLGFYYDVSVFQVNVKDRIESLQLTDIPGESIDVNTGNTRSRGIEGEADYDLLRLWNAPEAQHLSVFLNASYLDARFTSVITPADAGKVPAYSPRYVIKAGVTARRDGLYKLSLVIDSVAKQFFQDSDQPIPATGPVATPALIPSYTVADLSGDYTIAGHLRVLAGISNLTNRIYYSRVFISRGMLEPALERNFYAGLAYDF